MIWLLAPLIAVALQQPSVPLPTRSCDPRCAPYLDWMDGPKPIESELNDEERAFWLHPVAERLRFDWSGAEIHEIRSSAERDLRCAAGLRKLVIAGTLTLAHADGTAHPIRRRLDVTVGVSQRPAGTDGAPVSGWVNTTARTDGEGHFFAHFQTWAIEREPGVSRTFAVTASIPDVASWDAVAGSRASLVIAGPAKLSADLTLVSACAAPDPYAYDPIAMVRAVNRLRALGKDKALEVLREFVRLASQLGPGDGPVPRAGNLDTADSAAVFLIVRLLFDPVPDCTLPPDDWSQRIWPCDGEDGPLGHPLIFSGMMYARPPSKYPQSEIQGAGWPTYPLRFSGGLPFLTPWWVNGRTGSDSSPLTHLDWAEKCGRLRDAPLVPSGDPIEAAEAVMRSKELAPGNDPRRQVWLGLATEVGVPCPATLVHWAVPELLSDADWATFAAKARALKLHWDEATQRYVRGAPDSK